MSSLPPPPLSLSSSKEESLPLLQIPRPGPCEAKQVSSLVGKETICHNSNNNNNKNNSNKINNNHKRKPASLTSVIAKSTTKISTNNKSGSAIAPPSDTMRYLTALLDGGANNSKKRKSSTTTTSSSAAAASVASKTPSEKKKPLPPHTKTTTTATLSSNNNANNPLTQRQGSRAAPVISVAAALAYATPAKRIAKNGQPVSSLSELAALQKAKLSSRSTSSSMMIENNKNSINSNSSNQQTNSSGRNGMIKSTAKMKAVKTTFGKTEKKANRPISKTTPDTNVTGSTKPKHEQRDKILQSNAINTSTGTAITKDNETLIRETKESMQQVNNGTQLSCPIALATSKNSTVIESTSLSSNDLGVSNHDYTTGSYDATLKQSEPQPPKSIVKLPLNPYSAASKRRRQSSELKTTSTTQTTTAAAKISTAEPVNQISFSLLGVNKSGKNSKANQTNNKRPRFADRAAQLLGSNIAKHATATTAKPSEILLNHDNSKWLETSQELEQSDSLNTTATADCRDHNSEVSSLALRTDPATEIGVVQRHTVNMTDSGCAEANQAARSSMGSPLLSLENDHGNVIHDMIDLSAIKANRPIGEPVESLYLSSPETVLPKSSENEVIMTRFQRPPAPPRVSLDSVLQPIPIIGKNDDGNEDNQKNNKRRKKDQGNFVRLNLKDSAGACLGARNKKQKKKWRNKRGGEDSRYDNKKDSLNQLKNSLPLSTQSGLVDPVDDYLDGVYKDNNNKDTATKNTRQKQTAIANTIPKCSAHQRPCKLLKVKKNNDNKGREFYVCSLPRGEQCNHFQWVDDTVEAAKMALLKNSSHSGFLARQVAAYMDQVKCLTVAELQELAQRNGLINIKGKKGQLLTRLAIWVRDEIANSKIVKDDDEDKQDIATPLIEDKDEAENTAVIDCDSAVAASSMPDRQKNVNEIILEENDQSNDGSSDSDDSYNTDDSSSTEELEIVGKESDETSQLQQTSNLTQPPPEIACASIASNVEEPDDSLLGSLHRLFGHTSFREGQEWSIERILQGKRTLLVAPTGFGKSLCYALPAALLDGVCIVVSPLLSLIADQLRVLPPRLPAATLSGSMSTAKMAATLDDIIRGRIKVVFVSPERLTSASFRRLFRPRWSHATNSYERDFPVVSLLCVDEAHCLSQWAHNFRPSYLRLGSMLDFINPNSVLAITATAGPRVVEDICRTLSIHNGPNKGPSAIHNLPECGVRAMKTNRDNIDVSCFFCSSQGDRLSKLIKILLPAKESTEMEGSSELGDAAGCLARGSVIVYVWRQLDAEAVAENIRAAGVSGGVVVYHGGMDSSNRQKAQSKFMRGKARLCVATVAFGLGINKGDVAGVIHLYLSASPEHFLQEIGRAGRNGQAAKAVALVLHDEVLVRHSLAHSDLVSKSQIKALLSVLAKVVKDSITFLPAERPRTLPINAGLTLGDVVLTCDCKAETIETLLSLLEIRRDKDSLLNVQGVSYDTATIAPKRYRLEDLAEKEPLAKAILVCGSCIDPPAGELVGYIPSYQGRTFRKPHIGHSFGSYSFSVSKCANVLGPSAEPRHVFAALRRLESNGDIDLSLDTSISGRSLHLHLTSKGMETFLDEDEGWLEVLADELLSRVTTTIYTSANKVLDINYIIDMVGNIDKKKSTMEDSEPRKSASLVLFQELIEKYFTEEGRGNSLAVASQHLPRFEDDPSSRELSMDVRSALSHLRNIQSAANIETKLALGDLSLSDYTALLITKFLHGIPSACMTPSMLRNHNLYGRMQSTRFTALLEKVQALLQPSSNP